MRASRLAGADHSLHGGSRKWFPEQSVDSSLRERVGVWRLAGTPVIAVGLKKMPAMEYLVTMTTRVPEATPGKAVEDIRGRAEAPGGSAGSESLR